MHGAQIPEEHCQAGALKLLGDYVTLRIIDFLRSGELRFTELQRSMGDVNSVTLSNRLKRLETAGVLERKEATFDKQSVAYTLTDLGRGLLPVLREIQKFTAHYVHHRSGVLEAHSGGAASRLRSRKKQNR